MLTSKENHVISKIEDALQTNLECAGNLLLPNRIFITSRNGKPELLVLVDSRFGQFVDCFGHVA